jgi:hypothetical protein
MKLYQYYRQRYSEFFAFLGCEKNNTFFGLLLLFESVYCLLLTIMRCCELPHIVSFSYFCKLLIPLLQLKPINCYLHNIPVETV